MKRLAWPWRGGDCAKPIGRRGWRAVTTSLAAAAFAACGLRPTRADLAWSPGGASGGGGSWDLGSLNWTSGSANVAWDNTGSQVADFGGTGGYVYLNAPINASAGLAFDSAGYLLYGNTLTVGGVIAANATVEIDAPITARVPLTKTGGGTLTLGGAFGAYAASIPGASVQAGTLNFAAAPSGLSAAAANATLTGGTWSVSGGAALNFPDGTTLDTLNAQTSVQLRGVGATWSALNSITYSEGTFALTGGASFTSNSPDNVFANYGSLTVGAASAFIAPQNFNQDVGKLTVAPGGSLVLNTPGTTFGYNGGTVSGVVTLGNNVNLNLESDLTGGGVFLFDGGINTGGINTGGIITNDVGGVGTEVPAGTTLLAPESESRCIT